jgi:hypothetical protein
VSAAITIKDLNGFTGQVTLSLSALPKGVLAKVEGTGSKQRILFNATRAATTGFTTVTVTGTSGSTTSTTTLTLAVSAGLGTAGAGTPVDLSSDYDVNGIYDDGTTYTTGGLDGVGYSYSANVLTTSRVLNGTLFNFGPADAPDAIGGSGQVISLPQGTHSVLVLLATGVEGSQSSQTLTVTYTDGTSSKFLQSFSDWFTPQNFPRESEAVAMPYRDFDNGTKDERTFNLYAYQFPLNSAKVAASITLPNNRDVVVLAATVK